MSNEANIKEFRIRAYGRMELAQKYNPHLAPSTA